MEKQQSKSECNDCVITSERSMNHVVLGSRGKYAIIATVYNTAWVNGINGGRVGKLGILYQENTDIDVAPPTEVVYYNGWERGWERRPKTEADDKAFWDILDHLEQLPPEASDKAS